MKKLLLALLTFSAALTGCKEDKPSVNPMPLQFDQKEVSVAQFATVQLNITNLSDYGSGAKVIWQSGNTGTLLVSETGVISGVAVGETTVTAFIEGQRTNSLTSIPVKVTANSGTGIAISYPADSLVLKVGQKVFWKATFKYVPTTTSDQLSVVSQSDAFGTKYLDVVIKREATPAKEGLLNITALEPGVSTFYLYNKTTNTVVSNKITVTVENIAVTTFAFGTTPYQATTPTSVKLNTTDSLSMDILPRNASMQALQASSSDPSVLVPEVTSYEMVDPADAEKKITVQAIKLSPLKEGSATITVISNGGKVLQRVITVGPADPVVNTQQPTKLEFASSKVTLVAGGVEIENALSLIPTTATDAKVRFKLDPTYKPAGDGLPKNNTKVTTAYVDGKLKMSSVMGTDGTGQAKIIAYLVDENGVEVVGGPTASCEVLVQDVDVTSFAARSFFYYVDNKFNITASLAPATSALLAGTSIPKATLIKYGVKKGGTDNKEDVRDYAADKDVETIDLATSTDGFYFTKGFAPIEDKEALKWYGVRVSFTYSAADYAVIRSIEVGNGFPFAPKK